jgi:uncharacterized protein with PQ loop repeat
MLVKSMNEKNINRIGWFAAFMGTAMSISFIDQIRLNLSGHPGSVILPIVAVINCSSWFVYGIVKAKKDWPIIICNISGIILGSIMAITAII